MVKKMSNSRVKVLAGVLAGIAYNFKIDPFWVRLLFVIFLLSSCGLLTLAYFIMAMVMDSNDISKEDFDTHIMTKS